MTRTTDTPTMETDAEGDEHPVDGMRVTDYGRALARGRKSLQQARQDGQTITDPVDFILRSMNSS